MSPSATATQDSDLLGAPAPLDRQALLRGYRLAYQSRQASLLGRREVLSGKAKFGIFGDGKETAQLAMAGAFRAGDFRSGYYRDQTFMLATGLLTFEQLFAQLYADTDPEREPASAGRQMNSHFATHLVDRNGRWSKLSEMMNSAADSSPTASQMPRLVGLALASKIYRQLPELDRRQRFSNAGQEIAWGTIGDAACAEGPFWETINAVGVLGAPLLMSIWDDGYGISVPNEQQITKGDLSAVLSGFRRAGEGKPGYEIYTVRGWDYPTLMQTYAAAADLVRGSHVPVIVHVTEMTQPQGHSTSGSHERYKSTERLAWERRHDCLSVLRNFVLEYGRIEAAALEDLEQQDQAVVRQAQQRAWKAYRDSHQAAFEEASALLQQSAAQHSSEERRDTLAAIGKSLGRVPNPTRRHLVVALRDALLELRDAELAVRQPLIDLHQRLDREGRDTYASHLYSESPRAALEVPVVAPVYGQDSPRLNGYEILNHAFDAAFDRLPRLIAFGEDVGKLGDVNQALSGMQAKYGEVRVSDTGIRECTIVGQAIGMAMRGLRPLAEIQYLDYILYALQTLSDDLATLRYRTSGRQQAPVIIRTRGHRLEGIWHSGSPMAGILGLVRGVYLCVPRDMTRAAGMYNTLLASDDSAIVVEVLNGYRSKETLPENISQMTVPLGIPEVLREGQDVTIVTYGACCRIAAETADKLAGVGIEVELIDVQTLLPFDRHGVIGSSLQKTHRIVFLDEDVPGGATAYMQQRVIEDQGGYHWLDAKPRSVTGTEHRPAYGSDGDYWSKPSVESVFDAVYELLHEAEPKRFPLFFK